MSIYGDIAIKLVTLHLIVKIMIMKRLILLFTAIFLVCSCEFIETSLELIDKSDIVLAQGQKTDFALPGVEDDFNVSFTSSKEWRADIVYKGAADGWASLNRTSGNGGEGKVVINVSVDENTTGSDRSAFLMITSGRKSVEVSFAQSPKTDDDEEDGGDDSGDDEGDDDQEFPGDQDGGTVFSLNQSKASVSAEGGRITVKVRYNVEYYCTVDVPWITEVKTKGVSEAEHIFEVAANTTGESRSATISFCGNGSCVPFRVTQSSGNGNDDDNNDDNGDDDNDNGEDGGEDNGDGGDDGTVPSWVDERFYHRSLAMRFTADWCGYCPMMATAMSNAQKEMPGQIEVLNVHGYNSTYNCYDSNRLIDNSNIEGYPTGLIDGITMIDNYDISTTTNNILKAVKYTEENYDTVTGMSWTSSVSEDKVLVDLKAYIKLSGSYKVTVLLVEDDIVGYQADYNHGDNYNYVHSGVLRYAMTDVLGDEFSTKADNQEVKFNFSKSVPTDYKRENMRVVVYIQRREGKTMSFYVDNVASEKLGLEKKLQTIAGEVDTDTEGITPGDDITLN